MTSDDFKESLESGRDSACADHAETTVSESAGVAKVGCENGVYVNAENAVSVQDSAKDRDSDSVALPTENHTPTDNAGSQTANGEDVQQRDKAKKKKKKAKSKKSKVKQQEPDSAPSENLTSGHPVNNNNTNSVSSNSISHKSKLDNGKPGIPAVSSSSQHTAALASSASSAADKNSVAEADPQVDSAGREPTAAASSDGGKTTASQPQAAAACSRVAGEGSGGRDDHDVYARVETVKSKASLASATKMPGKIEKGSLRLDLESVGRSSHRNLSDRSAAERGFDDASLSVENELLDSWGLSSILSRGLTPEDSRVVIEGGDNEALSPRDGSGGKSKRRLTGDLPGLLKTVSDSVGDVSVGGGNLSNLRASWQNGDIFWVIVFPLSFPNRTLCTVGSFFRSWISLTSPRF